MIYSDAGRLRGGQINNLTFCAVHRTVYSMTRVVSRSDGTEAAVFTDLRICGSADSRVHGFCSRVEECGYVGFFSPHPALVSRFQTVPRYTYITQIPPLTTPPCRPKLHPELASPSYASSSTMETPSAATKTSHPYARRPSTRRSQWPRTPVRAIPATQRTPSRHGAGHRDGLLRADTVGRRLA